MFFQRKLSQIYTLTQPHSIQHSTLLSFLYVYKEAVLKSILVYNFKSLFRLEYWMEKHCTTAEIFQSISQVSHTISPTQQNKKIAAVIFYMNYFFLCLCAHKKICTWVFIDHYYFYWSVIWELKHVLHKLSSTFLNPWRSFVTFCNRIATMIIRGTAWWSSLYFSSVPHVVTKYLIVVSERGSLYTNESLTVCHKKYTKSLSLLLYFKLVSVNTATPVYTRKILDLMRLKYVKCSIESVALKQIISQRLDEFMSVILHSEIESAEKYIVG